MNATHPLPIHSALSHSIRHNCRFQAATVRLTRSSGDACDASIVGDEMSDGSRLRPARESDAALRMRSPASSRGGAIG